jgi:hypothetical protein
MSLRCRNFLLAGTAAVFSLVAGVSGLAQQAELSIAPSADLVSEFRFASLDVVIDAAEPLAAWQFELTDRNGAMLIVGVENGDSDAFSDAPYFDLDAVSRGNAERIIVADFNAAPNVNLPSGAVRIATVHVRYSAQIDPDYQLRLVAAGNAAGEPIEADIRIAN